MPSPLNDKQIGGSGMSEVKFVEHQGKRILLMDFAGVTNMELLSSLVDESILLVKTVNTPHSVLALIDLSNTRINRALMASLKRLSRNNGPYIRAITFIGMPLVARTLLSIMLRVTKRRNHKVIPDRNQAYDWLVRQ
jgi:hypothetical protein